MNINMNSQQGLRVPIGKQILAYWPLISLVVISGLAACAISLGSGHLSWHAFMHYYMGLFLVVFALLKIFDVKGFQKGFAKYDLLAGALPAYGYIYPVLELGLGLAYLAFFVPLVTYTATILVFGFGTLGVLSALQRGLNISCPCMGTILHVPLSTVTLTEDLAMVVMAAVMLASGI